MVVLVNVDFKNNTVEAEFEMTKLTSIVTFCVLFVVVIFLGFELYEQKRANQFLSQKMILLVEVSKQHKEVSTVLHTAELDLTVTNMVREYADREKSENEWEEVKKRFRGFYSRLTELEIEFKISYRDAGVEDLQEMKDQGSLLLDEIGEFVLASTNKLETI